MRQYLITKMACAKCGKVLSLTYNAPDKQNTFVNGEPSGAFKLEQIVYIEPCSTCLRPLYEIKSALSVLTKSLSEDL